MSKVKMAAIGAATVLLLGTGTVIVQQVLAQAATPRVAQTQPATIDPDSPRAMIVQFVEAAYADDWKRMRSCIHARDERESIMADSLAQRLTADTALHSAVTKRFGDTGKKFGGPPTMSDVQAATENVTGDNGWVRLPGDGDILPVIRVDGKWKIDLIAKARMKGANLNKMDDEIRGNLASAQASREVEKEVAAGQYKSPQEVFDARRKRQMALMQTKAASATTAAKGG